MLGAGARPMTDRDDLLRLLAVQNNLLAPEVLDAAARDCRRDNLPLGPTLLARGLLRQEELAGLEALAEGQAERRGDTDRTLATFCNSEAARPAAGGTAADPHAPTLMK